MTEISTGCEFSLARLFSGSTKIVIPDMQRDYCWGHDAFVKAEKVTRGLVDGFVRKLISLYSDQKSRNQKMILGLVYGYEEPANSLNICDGQQRLTTLFLLLGMVNRRHDKFQGYLLSDEGAASEARLRYSIRESTLYFINDLTKHFFIAENSLPVAEIKGQEWYFQDYDTDPSIQNIISALQAIEDIFADETTDVRISNFKDFGEYILNSLCMIYYDMGTRARGEETYIVINTTGEPLSSTENIKPIMLGNVKSEEQVKIFNDQWERREDWFWAKRAPGEDVADDGLADFLKWTLQLREKVEDYSRRDKKLTTRDMFVSIASSKDPKEIPLVLTEIEKNFIALKALVDFVEKQKKEENVFGRIVDDLGLSSFNAMRHAQSIDVVPMLAYVKKFGCDANFHSFLMRLWKAKCHKDRFGALDKWNLKKILELIDSAKTSTDLCRYDVSVSGNELRTLLRSSALDSVWLDADEQSKIQLVIDATCPKLKDGTGSDSVILNSNAVVNHLSEVVAKIRKWEMSDIFKGDLQPLWDACGKTPTIEKAERAYENACLLERCLTGSDKEDSVDEIPSAPFVRFANYYRLYRVLTGASPIGHFPNMSYNMQGVKFSWGSAIVDKKSQSYHDYLKDKNYIDLISCESAIEMFNRLQLRIWKCIDEIFNVIGSGALSECVKSESFDVVTYIKLWMAAKVLYANELGVLIHKDGSTIAAYSELSENRIDSNHDFSLCNSRCGHPVLRRGRIEYRHENVAEEDRPCYLDTSISKDTDMMGEAVDVQALFHKLAQKCAVDSGGQNS